MPDTTRKRTRHRRAIWAGTAFAVFGPFELPLAADGGFDATPAARRRVLADIAGREDGLAAACGCFVFSLRGRAAALPWYVGRADGGSFAEVCLSDACLRIYAQAQACMPCLDAHLHLLGRLDCGGLPASGTGAEIACVEQALIRLARARNPALLNADGEAPLPAPAATLLRPLYAPRTIDARALRAVLGL
ncbi:hypothetical protein [Solimonas variicoloris]|uniref:hypothetical protein n=1 Tax=Solimonas variicoloris TaxID=254408 RepID=UPI0003A46CB1|nr:hypothetical protein [Solimonas variicoloris]